MKELYIYHVTAQDSIRITENPLSKSHCIQITSVDNINDTKEIRYIQCDFILGDKTDFKEDKIKLLEEVIKSVRPYLISIGQYTKNNDKIVASPKEAYVMRYLFNQLASVKIIQLNCYHQFEPSLFHLIKEKVQNTKSYLCIYSPDQLLPDFLDLAIQANPNVCGLYNTCEWESKKKQIDLQVVKEIEKALQQYLYCDDYSATDSKTLAMLKQSLKQYIIYNFGLVYCCIPLVYENLDDDSSFRRVLDMGDSRIHTLYLDLKNEIMYKYWLCSVLPGEIVSYLHMPIKLLLVESYVYVSEPSAAQVEEVVEEEDIKPPVVSTTSTSATTTPTTVTPPQADEKTRFQAVMSYAADHKLELLAGAVCVAGVAYFGYRIYRSDISIGELLEGICVNLQSGSSAVAMAA
ncbi:MAG: hypothetical protein ACK5WS_05780 [Alphaproteobacteria bacterium]|nr:hypothetical protein [Candidatus Jidaibacter sp.]